MLTSKERAILRKEANGLDPVFQVGKGEIDEMLIRSVVDCLAARELIKLKVLETSAYSAREAADLLAEAANCDSVQVIGSKFVLYKQKEKDSKFADLLHPSKAARKPSAKPAAKSGAKSGAKSAAKPARKAPYKSDYKKGAASDTKAYQKRK